MKLFTKAQKNKLVMNFYKNRQLEEQDTFIDFNPVIKLFTPDSSGTWLLTELDPETNIAFGIADLGLGFAEMGSISIEELESVRGHFGLSVERDLHFKGHKPLSKYLLHGQCSSEIDFS